MNRRGYWAVLVVSGMAVVVCMAAKDLVFFVETVKHKWYVLRAAFMIKSSLWDALLHDISKFSWAEYPHYQQKFYGEGGDPNRFTRAWVHHCNYNPHHWQHWVFGEIVLEMPRRQVLNMLADWIAVRRAQAGTWDKVEWKPLGLFDANVHPETKKLIGELLEKYRLPHVEN